MARDTLGLMQRRGRWYGEEWVWRNLDVFENERSCLRCKQPFLHQECMFGKPLYHPFVLLLNIQWALFSAMELVMGCCLKRPHLGVQTVL